MAEPVRLLIWDLDETFWRGTLTEGGHLYDRTTHDIVVALAKRGVISSICSKNDFATVKAILEESGIWPYFVFPSIDWSAKGPRIRELVDSVQLRPETIMLIDDNPSNLREAQHHVPGLQVAPHTFVPDILDSPLFRGKPDQDMSRLQQYKLLERRKADQAVAVKQSPGSNTDFLRSCNIRVRIEHDIVGHVDRAVELINRTNQLNFTKIRLPEDPEQARAALLELAKQSLIQIGLIDVSDDYGEYGLCGLYVAKSVSRGSRLLHYCFSCRILDMGVEAWVYQVLGRPHLRIVGDVLSDPIKAPAVDWIRLDGGDGSVRAAAAVTEGSSVAARGGCVLMPLIHYFQPIAARTVGEYNIIRHGIAIRLDHSLCFRYALEGVPPAAMAAFASLGYLEADFRTAYFDHSGPNPVWIFSNWADVGPPVFRHRQTGCLVPYRSLPLEACETEPKRRAMEYLDKHFEPAKFGRTEIVDNLRAVFARVPNHGRMFVLLGLAPRDSDGKQSPLAQKREQLNMWVAEAAADYDQVQLLPMADFVEHAAEVSEGSNFGHFDRMVYYRIYRRIVSMLAEPPALR